MEFDLSMTPLEKRQKEIMAFHPEFPEKIMTSDEFAAFIREMIQEYGSESENYENSSLFLDPNPTGIVTLGRSLQMNPKDTKTAQLLAEAFEDQNEDRFILSSHDISVGRFYRYTPGHWHANSFFVLYYNFSGNCSMYYQDEIVPLRPGSVLISAPGSVHACSNFADDKVLFYFQIRSSTFDQVFWNLISQENLMSSFFRKALNEKQTTSYIHFETGDDPQIRDMVISMIEEYRRHELYCSQMMNSLMGVFFSLLMRRYEGTAKLPRSDSFYWKHEYSAILNYIQTHFTVAKLSDVANHFSYSTRQINRIVCQSTGMNYADLIIRLRMEHAAALLKTRTNSIQSISSTLGYANTSSFYRIFTRYYGCTPAEYQTKVIRPYSEEASGNDLPSPDAPPYGRRQKWHPQWRDGISAV